MSSSQDKSVRPCANGGGTDGDELRVGVVTCSDSQAEGAEDTGGHSLIEACEERGWYVIAYHVCPDDEEAIITSLADLCDAEEADVVFTIGGTGLDPRDVTPEATEIACERMVPGVAEAIRHCSELADPVHICSRATAGIRGRSLIVNLPGGKKPAMSAFDVIAEHIQCAAHQLQGRRPTPLHP